MAAGNRKAIFAALRANLGLAAAKFVGWAVTGAASMLAEAVHSLADSGNQVLLLWGGAAAKRPATPEHPFGHGRERYFWSCVVALVIFTLGALFALYEGFRKILHPEPLNSPWIAIAILLVGIVLEGFSLRTAVNEARQAKRKQTWWTYIRHSKSPELPVVLLEDLGALMGLFMALLGVSFAAWTGSPRYDALGSISIGLLLGAIAVVLAVEMKSLLIGEAADPMQEAEVRGAGRRRPEPFEPARGASRPARVRRARSLRTRRAVARPAPARLRGGFTCDRRPTCHRWSDRSWSARATGPHGSAS